MRYGQKPRLHLIAEESSLLSKRPPMPPGGAQRRASDPTDKHHRGDASPCRNAAIVTAVTRNAWNGTPTCGAFPRIDRSDASSTALGRFGLKLEHQV